MKVQEAWQKKESLLVHKASAGKAQLFSVPGRFESAFITIKNCFTSKNVKPILLLLRYI